ncbi:DUF4089 domain-containing protein [Asaia krungthepensis]|uniref:DUF4089 domain-containing protein n=1 Tax=Asaia krungthepensis NRIC 0535 TaxID=1307925 RepID=A0ABQ0Q5I7_9PROT|nr:DUF4089 domain-containing protein [Asaia krungthepensis]GBQ92323.1 hypothetical protein AA0535_2517 [Asaia krungthepensis NRIC 0535]
MIGEDELAARAAALGLVIPEEYRSEVMRNLALIGQYEALVMGLDLPERLEPAFEYHP